MKFTPRFTLAFILYAAALLVGVGLLAYTSGRSSLRSTTIAELEGTALRKENNLNSWIEEKQLLITAMSADPAILRAASSLMTAHRDSTEFHAAHEAFVASVQPRLETSQFLVVSILDPGTGQVIASTAQDEEGKFKDDQPYFLNGKTGPFVQNPYYSISLQSIAMTASAPLNSVEGNLLGVLAARLDMQALDTLINRRTNIHNTDDAYLINTANLFVTQPRLVSDPAVLQRGTHTEDINRCLQQQSGVLETVDYRDVPSFVVYRWIPNRQLCLVVKIDQSEAYAPIRVFGRTILFISILALAAAIAIAIALARGLTRPILSLQNSVARFARGDLDVRLPETSGDELGQLAAEFNKMAKSLSEQQTHLRRHSEQFFNLTLDLLCTIDASGRLLDLNPAWQQALGYDNQELHGCPLTDLIHPDDLDLTSRALHQVANTRSGRFASRCRHKGGEYRWLAWVIVFSSQDQLFYATARDITEQRLGEEKLRQQAEELERSNRDLEQFAQAAAHDLQEPLRLVTNNVQFLARRYQGKLDKDADEFIGVAMDAAARMKKLISDLLAYLQVASEGKKFKPVALEETLQQVLDTLSPVIQNTGTIVTHELLPRVLADDLQMLQLLQNLIENSIKFRGKESPRIHVGVRPLGERWLIFIRDNGIGIDPQYTERVFVLFQRLHNQEQYPGTGIGLAIGRKIVERHGGRIWVDSEPGKGATFYFTLQPAESWTPALVPAEVVKPLPKDSVVDRAKDLI